jgi:hypothetical protein
VLGQAPRLPIVVRQIDLRSGLADGHGHARR